MSLILYWIQVWARILCRLYRKAISNLLPKPDHMNDAVSLKMLPVSASIKKEKVNHFRGLNEQSSILIVLMISCKNWNVRLYLWNARLKKRLNIAKIKRESLCGLPVIYAFWIYQSASDSTRTEPNPMLPSAVIAM